MQDIQLIKTTYPYYQYQKAKSKTPKGDIFFIHGYAVNSSYHHYFSDKLTDYNYYAVEHAGHGITPLKDKKQLSPYSFALETAELIKKLKLKNIILIGHSMGGGIAVMVSQMIPELIKKMVIVTPMNSRGTTKIFNFLFRFNPKNHTEIDAFYDIIMHDYQKQKNKLSKLEVDDVIRLQNEYANNFKILKWKMASIKNLWILSKNEKNIKVPTLLIVGKSDGCINPKTTIKNFKRKNKDIKVYQFEKSGHIPFFEQTNEYYKLIMEFINE